MLVHILNRREQAKMIKLFDRRCFPQEMILSDDEIKDMLENRTEVYGWTNEDAWQPNLIRGLMFLCPEFYVIDELVGWDPDYEPDGNGMYLYSIGVPSWHRGNGYARALTKAACALAHTGYTSLASHARMSNGWNEAQARILKPTERRIAPNLWEKDGSVEFQRVVF